MFLIKQIVLTVLLGLLLALAGCQTTTKVSGDIAVDYRTSKKL